MILFFCYKGSISIIRRKCLTTHCHGGCVKNVQFYFPLFWFLIILFYFNIQHVPPSILRARFAFAFILAYKLLVSLLELMFILLTVFRPSSPINPGNNTSVPQNIFATRKRGIDESTDLSDIKKLFEEFPIVPPKRLKTTCKCSK
jgi:hypothetical protein